MLKPKEARLARKIWTGDYNQPTVNGDCLVAGDIAETFGGDHWRSDLARDDPRQKYPGHSIAVVPTGRGKSGVVVD